MNNIIPYEKVRRDLKAAPRVSAAHGKIIPFPLLEQKPRPANVISFPLMKPE